MRPLHDGTWRSVEWISRAQDAEPSGGVPAMYRPFAGWSDPYPETTGYIIPTFLELARRYERPELRDRARCMGEWLLRIQHEDGAFPGGIWSESSKRSASVFNSGQILFGLVALHADDGDARWRDAGTKCGQWLTRMQDSDGAWRRFTYRDTLHVYKTRVAWALALAGTAWNLGEFAQAAERNLRISLESQRADGWLENASFDAGAPPVLHTFAYAVQGFLEGGVLLNVANCIDAAARGAKLLASLQGKDGSLPGEIGEDLTSRSYRCLTGIAQTAIVWARLAELGIPGGDWRRCASTALEYLRARQVKRSGHLNDGGLAGSYPLWGPYMRFRYPNWAVKFFIDAEITTADEMGTPAWG
jgi:hypothetical protein